MRVFLTGATRFIGSHVARLLVNEGCEVHALVRAGSSLWRIEDIASRIRLVQGDLLSIEGLKDVLGEIRPELCIHLAWYAVPGQYASSPENLKLLHASLQLASLMAELRCRRFVGVGTCFEYDASFGYLSEETPVRPQSLYAASKLAMKMVLEQLASGAGMEAAWVRLFYQYGPFEHEQRLVASVIRSLLRQQAVKTTKGEQVRDFLHIEDVARAIWAVAQSNLTGTVNVGSGQPVTVRDIVSRIGAILNRSDLIAFGALPYSPLDPMFICCNNRRLTSRTGWTPQFDLEAGLRHAVEWWRQRLGDSERLP